MEDHVASEEGDLLGIIRVLRKKCGYNVRPHAASFRVAARAIFAVSCALSLGQKWLK